MHFDKLRDIWEDLRTRLSQRDAQRISSLQSEIHNLKQGTLSVNEYYTKSRTLWEQMNNMRPIPLCKCTPKCSCDLVEVIRNERELDQVILFLKGLNGDYDSLKSSVLVLDPLPEVYKVFVMAEKLERQVALRNLNLGNFDLNQSNAIQSNLSEEIIAASSYNGRKFNGAKAKCTYCGMSGHTVDRCYKKHGFLSGWIQGYKTKNKQPVTTSFLNNSDLGITSEQLQKLISAFQTQQTQPSGPSSSNVTSAIALTPKFDELHTDSEDNFSINSFSLSSHTWILDSGATNNIVCSLDCLTNYHMVDEVKVNLPTGQCISVEHIGDAKLSENLCLKEALHIPSFKFNIVSVSKLIEDAAYTLTFMSKQCTIQGIHGQIVGLAKEENGLYIWVEPKSQNKCYVMQCTSPELWHQRLGHFSTNKLHLLCDIYRSKVKNIACDVCHISS
ncbi:PREDICTED: uncharacterized protein LOC109171674 [Ipomoea nil]|uniref:uncharacterized protein LOC109171674 n=1 Tax=Ipomoea nil TaxID=35883 RepID=UPI000900E811|nr:PREDICTED: uncharacterized protein LOC109171674 [Ipomoea nil]